MLRQKEQHPTGVMIARIAGNATVMLSSGPPSLTLTIGLPRPSLGLPKSGCRNNCLAASHASPRRNGGYANCSKRFQNAALQFFSNWHPAMPLLGTISCRSKRRRRIPTGGVTQDANRHADTYSGGAGLGNGSCWD
jgi:hypothetical protein